PTRKRTVNVAVKTVDPKNGTAELLLDDLWRGDERMKFVEEEKRGGSIWAGAGGNGEGGVGPGGRGDATNSILHSLHSSFQLNEATWKGDAVRLTFRESAE